MNKTGLEKLAGLTAEKKFFITVSVYNEKKNGQHIDAMLINNDFPTAELDEARKMISKLITKEKKKIEFV